MTQSNTWESVVRASTLPWRIWFKDSKLIASPPQSILVMEAEHPLDIASDPEVSSMLMQMVRQVDPKITSVVFSTGSIWFALDEHLKLHRIDNPKKSDGVS